MIPNLISPIKNSHALSKLQRLYFPPHLSTYKSPRQALSSIKHPILSPPLTTLLPTLPTPPPTPTTRPLRKLKPSQIARLATPAPGHTLLDLMPAVGVRAEEAVLGRAGVHPRAAAAFYCHFLFFFFLDKLILFCWVEGAGWSRLIVMGVRGGLRDVYAEGFVEL